MSGSRGAPPFQSFWMGGFEGADHINGRGEHLDMVRDTGHADRLDQDYRRARQLGLRTIRESIGWRLTEDADGRFDFSRAVAMAQAAQRHGLQILWTLMHYGVPPGVTLLDDAIVPRFARFAAEAARVLAPLCPGPRFYTPINEISFLSWAASASDAMGPAGVPPSALQPDAGDDSRISGFQIKKRLVRAALAGIRAIREVDPQARFLHVEPVVHVAPPADQPEFRPQADRISAFQWQAFDMLAGRMEPELGGHPEALDWLGMNHYHSSQWETPSEKRLSWHLRDPRRMPLADLLESVWRRYHRPLVVAETGHIGVGRGPWLQEIAGEALRARARGVPLGGVCLYPLLDRPDWHDAQVWHRSGLWHVPPTLSRRLNKPFARALLDWRHLNDPKALATHTADGSDTGKPGLMLMLPQPWETWPARHQAAALSLARDFVLRLVEPPRCSRVGPVLRRHTLAPHAELLVLHRARDGDGERDGWQAAPDEEALALLHQDRSAMGTRRWWCWPWSSSTDGMDPGWVTALAGDGVIHHPQRRDERPSMQWQSLVRLQVPADWPPTPVAVRQLVPDSYEAEEARRWAPGAGTPTGAAATAWLQMGDRAHQVMDPDQVHVFRALARQHPAWQLLVDAPAPPVNGEADPPNLRWLGPLHPALHAPLAACVKAALPYELWTRAAADLRALSALCGEALAQVDASQIRQDALQVQAAHQAWAAELRQQLKALGG